MKNPYLRLATFALHIRKELMIKIFLQLLISITYIAQAFMLSYGTMGVFEGKKLNHIAVYYIAAGICIVFRGLVMRRMEGYTKKVAGKAKAILRNHIVNKLIDVGPGYQATKRSGRLQSLVTDGIEYVEPYLVNYIPQIFVVILSSIFLGGYIFSLNGKVGTIIIVAMLISILMPHFMMPVIKQSAIGYWKGYAVLNAQYVDAMQGMNTLKVLGAVGEKGKELYGSAESFRKKQIRWTSFSLLSSATIALMMATGKSFAVGVSAIHLSLDLLLQRDLLIILFLVSECIRPIKELDDAWHASYLGLSVAHELLEIMDEPLCIYNPTDPVVSGLEEGFPSIEFDDVTFGYPGREDLALKNVTFSIRPGESVAIVGKSGGGKSTITNLLLRFYDTDGGTIKINGVDIRKYSLEYLRSKMAIVFQDTYLFYGTVEENIGMAKVTATKDEIVRAAKMANAHDFITRMPKGYETMVGERGATLSGGEKQRIAIARAILKKGSILILDEATSSVDAANEERIKETLIDLEKEHTSITIAHRLSTIKHIKNILVFEQGNLVEKGSHEELMAKDGVYQQLYEAQSNMEG